MVQFRRSWGENVREHQRRFRFAPGSITTRGFRSVPREKALARIQAHSRERALQRLLGYACGNTVAMFPVRLPVAALTAEDERVSRACLEWLNPKRSDKLRLQMARRAVVEPPLPPALHWRAAQLLDVNDLSPQQRAGLGPWLRDPAPEHRLTANRLYFPCPCVGRGSKTREQRVRCLRDALSARLPLLEDAEPAVQLAAIDQTLHLAERIADEAADPDIEGLKAVLPRSRVRLAGLIDDPDPEVRRKVLPYIDDPDLLEDLSDYDPDAGVRKAAFNRWQRLHQAR